MIHLKKHLKNVFRGAILSSLVFTAFLGLEEATKKPSLAGPGMIEFQWDPDPNFKKLRSYQSSAERLDRAIYYFFLRSSERKTGILKLTIKIPDYFDAKIKPEKLSLCQAKIGGWQEKTKCVKVIPAEFEIAEDQSAIDVYPAQPIPVDQKTYAVVMKIWNPRKSGMFQFKAFAQSPGAMPMSSYVGTWTFDVD